MNNQKFWSLMIYIFLSVAILWVLVGVFGSIWASTIFEDDFNSYEVGSLDTQGDWVKIYATGAYVVDTPVAEGTRAVRTSEVTGGLRITEKTGTPIGIGTLYFYAYPLVDGSGSIRLDDSGGVDWLGILLREHAGPETDIEIDVFDGCDMYESIGGINFNEWTQLGIEWDKNTGKTRFLIDTTWSDYYTCGAFDSDLDTIGIYGASLGETNWYVDFLSATGELPVLERVWSISPASETEITDLETTFEFGWEDLDDWDTLSVVFHNRTIGIFSQAKEFLIETIGTSGTMELTFEDFNFDRNAKFYFHAIASKLEIEIIEGMYLTGGYSYYWSEDLVDPETWYSINIEELEPIFEMSEFENWYGDTAKFATSTAMFVSIAGFFEPIFNKIGEFGSRIEDYFKVNEAYAQGYEIGKTMSYFAFFVGQTTLFLGGFPILKWVFILILLLVGIFIFRLILKFIPTLG